MVDATGQRSITRQDWWPPARGSRGRKRAVIWPSPFRISWPPTGIDRDLGAALIFVDLLSDPPKHKSLSGPWRTGQRTGKKVRRRPWQARPLRH